MGRAGVPAAADEPAGALRGALAEAARAFDELARAGGGDAPTRARAAAARARLAALLARLKEAGGPALVGLDSLNKERKDTADKVARVMRKRVTGSGERSIRGFLRDELQQPPVVRAMDKVAFTASILNIMAGEFVLLSHPALLWVLYAALIVPLVLLRFLYYRRRKWHYFLLDFCYFAQVLCLLQVFMFPQSCALQKANFAFATGPLAWAVPIWRNSLVFHSMDKVTSTLVHILPSWLMYTLRWHGQQLLAPGGWPAAVPLLPLRRAHFIALAPQRRPGGAPPVACDAFGVADWLLAIALYLLWQGAYFARTEIVDKEKLDADPEIQTSLRWMSAETKGGMAGAVLNLCRRIGVMAPGEVFDSSTVKTKVVFMTVQFLFTLATFLPAPLMYSSHSASVVFLVGIFTCALANGSNYYIEVFSRRYYDATMSRGSTKDLQAASKLASAVSSTDDGSDGPDGEGGDTIVRDCDALADDDEDDDMNVAAAAEKKEH